MLKGRNSSGKKELGVWNWEFGMKAEVGSQKLEVRKENKKKQEVRSLGFSFFLLPTSYLHLAIYCKVTAYCINIF
jgi:hypothetical protein